MRKFAIGLALLAGLGLAVPVAAPASAETVKKVIIKKKGDRGYHRGHAVKKVVIRRGDRGRHYGWRNKPAKKVVVKKTIIRRD